MKQPLSKNRKGLSQILYLIIAAAVMMMVALSLIFGFNSSFDDGGVDACRGAINSQCQIAADGATIDAPSVCQDANGNYYNSQIEPLNDDGSVEC